MASQSECYFCKESLSGRSVLSSNCQMMKYMPHGNYCHLDCYIEEVFSKKLEELTSKKFPERDPNIC